MIDHILLKVPPSLYTRTLTFYTAALAPLGYTKQLDFPNQAAGFGTSAQDAKFWIGATGEEGATSACHFAFRAKERGEVDRFYEEAVKAGAKGNGGPGIREMYHEGYYAAFVIDPVGNNLEVVDHGAR
ncbi:glyoxalase family protein [Polyplosphaeria fusca]|uniref:Glyoxalase family protein n=1 Tax=Polyplosphaeria fusca TaxID=682080 RepID=A0A9P4QUJ8_9PLEO|nr:glyoxalase family protein [Polyplosphaeria fusca]